MLRKTLYGTDPAAINQELKFRQENGEYLTKNDKEQPSDAPDRGETPRPGSKSLGGKT